MITYLIGDEKLYHGILFIFPGMCKIEEIMKGLFLKLCIWLPQKSPSS